MIKRLKTPAALAPGMLLALLSCARLDSHAGPGVYFHRGVNFTAERSVRYDAPEARTMLERLPEWGSQHRGAGPVRVRAPESGPRGSQPTAQLAKRRGDGAARAKGMKVFLRPHVWRGPEMELTDPDELQEWFRQYAAFLDHYAAFAVRIQADLSCIGVELKGFSKYDERWRDLIARVRRIFKGPLVYAAITDRSSSRSASGTTSTTSVSTTTIPCRTTCPLRCSIARSAKSVPGAVHRSGIQRHRELSPHALGRRNGQTAVVGRPGQAYDALLRGFYARNGFKASTGGT